MFRRTNINLINDLVTQDLPHPLGKLNTHILSTAIDRDAVHDSVGSRKIDIFENVRRVRFLLDHLAENGVAALLNKDCLAWLDVADVAETELL